MTARFADVLEISLAMSVVLAVLLALRPLLKKRLRAGAFYWVWLLAALRLCIPFNLSLPQAPVTVEAVPRAVYRVDTVNSNPGNHHYAALTEEEAASEEAAAENRRLIHDIKHHLRTIDRMASEHGQTEICSFLLQVEEQVAATSGHSPAQFCKNPVVNALIEYYYGMAQTQGTEFQVRLDLPDQIPLTDVELCTVLGNLLDNAVEACSRQKQGLRRVFIAGETRGNMYFLKIENTYDGLAFQEGKTFLSRKGASADHGIGLSSVRKIIEGHGGDLDLVPGEESFLAGITIQM